MSYSIGKFYSKALRTQRCGTYQIKDIANMDQTPLPFVMDDEKTYTDKGSFKVWCPTHGSGLNKKQCSVQLTIFADGKPPAKHYFMKQKFENQLFKEMIQRLLEQLSTICLFRYS